MSTALAVREPANLTEIKEVATILANSGFFRDTTQMAQAVAKILAGQELGFGAVASLTGIYIIDGRIAHSAHIMAAKVKGTAGYDYRVKHLDDQSCVLEFYRQDKLLGESIFTLQDAQRAGTKNMGKFPRNMLFARAMSNGVRWHCPEVMGGGPVYTPDELGASLDDDGNVIDLPHHTTTAVVEPTATTTGPTATQVQQAMAGQVPAPPAEGPYAVGALDYQAKNGQVYVNIAIDPQKSSTRAWALAEKRVSDRPAEERGRIVAKVQSLFVYDRGPQQGHQNPYELENHLKKHFHGKARPEELNFEELAALLTWKIGGVADDRWYADKLPADGAGLVDTLLDDPRLAEIATQYGLNPVPDNAVDFLRAVARMPDPYFFKNALMAGTRYNWSWATHSSQLDALAVLVDLDPEIGLDSPAFWEMVNSYVDEPNDN